MEESLEQSLSSIGEDAARATCPSCMSLSSTRGRGLPGRDRGRERLVYFILLLFFCREGGLQSHGETGHGGTMRHRHDATRVPARRAVSRGTPARQAAGCAGAAAAATGR